MSHVRNAAGTWIVAAVLATSALSTSPATAQTLTSTAFTDYPPFTTDQLPRGGFSTALVEDVFKQAGYTVETQWLPWARGYAAVLSTDVDVTHAYFYRSERVESFLFSDPYFEVPQRLYTYVGDETPIETVADMVGRVLCNPIGYSTPEPLGEMIRDGQVEREQPTDLEACFRLLSRGRVDAVAASPLIFTAMADQRAVDSDKIEYSGVQVAVDALHLLVSRSNPGAETILAAFNEGLADMAADGSLAALAQEYGLPLDLVPPLR